MNQLEIILNQEHIEFKIGNQIKTFPLSTTINISEFIFQIAHSPEYIKTRYLKYDFLLNNIVNMKLACETIYNTFNKIGININPSLISDQIYIAKQLKIPSLEDKLIKWKIFYQSFQKTNDLYLLEEIQKRLLNLTTLNFNDNLFFFADNFCRFNRSTFFLILCKIYIARPQMSHLLFSLVESLSKIESIKIHIDPQNKQKVTLLSEVKLIKTENDDIKHKMKIGGIETETGESQSENEEESQTETEKDNQSENEEENQTEDGSQSENEKNQTETEEDNQSETGESQSENEEENQTETEEDNQTETGESQSENEEENQTEIEDGSQTETEEDNQTETEEDNQTETEEDNQTETEEDNQTETEEESQTETYKESKLESEENEDIKDIKTEIKIVTNTNRIQNSPTQKEQDTTHNSTMLSKFSTFVLKNSYFIFELHHRKRSLFYRILYNHKLIDRSKINLFPFKSDSGLFYQTGQKEINTNPDYISKILRKDDVESLIQIYNEDSTFEIDSFVKDSTFETCEISEQINYLCYCAFYGSSKCFDFLIANKAQYSSDLVLFAVAGGNVHIIHQCEYLDLDFKRKNVLVLAIKYHQNDVCDWLIESKFNNDENSIDFIMLEEVCLNYCNFEMFFKFIEKGYLNFYFFKFIAKFKIKIFYHWMKSCKLFFLIKYEIVDHIKFLLTHYERYEDEIKEIFEIIVEMIPNLPNETVALLKSDNKFNELLLIYQKYNR